MTLGAHMLTFQGHPEFIPEYSREIMNFRHDMIGAERVAEGMASFEWRQHEGDRVARWMLAFLNRQELPLPDILHRLPWLLQRQGVTGLQ